MSIQETPIFKIQGLTLVECNIDPSKCPVRKIRFNPHLTGGSQHMCQHSDAPEVTEETLNSGGFKYRTCVTKDKTLE